ncbi:DUF736 domain-containing protein [Rubrimonas cliftonensis]|uniref:Uncharacterized conserved protein, DUF736 family n=1 Tax=Rubrimonas cliftonensis TaxID=89524 RepID=A0A1H4ERV6_9RHOB|nr:DUF736 domain-containing protein [Rubrimonas cliftonensis]SEA87824.1 Uncharacterized conserved protein, DUF736 family [Rubrimonas cliftonensis]
MATIGTVTRRSDATYAGTLQLKSYTGKTLFRPTGATGDKAPAYRIYGAGDHGGPFEMGAAWIKMRTDGQGTYVSVKLDYPELPAPIYATLGRAADQDDDDVFAVIWNRPDPNRVTGGIAGDPFAGLGGMAAPATPDPLDPIDAMAPIETPKARRGKLAPVEDSEEGRA